MSNGPEIEYQANSEQIVIGAALANEEARRSLVHKIGDSEFLVPEHPPIWRALRQIANRKMIADLDTLNQMISAEGGKVDATYIDLLRRKGVQENLDHHVATFRWASTRARLVKDKLPELVQLIGSGGSPDKVSSIARAIAKSADDQGKAFLHRPEVIFGEYRASANQRASFPGLRFPTGFDPMDALLTEGTAPRNTSIVVGLPGAGKTTLACAMALGAARLKRKVMYCAWEMKIESILDIMNAQNTGIEISKIVQGRLTQEERRRVEKSTGWIVRNVKFMGNPFRERKREERRFRPSNDENLDLLEGYLIEAGCDFVVFDLWERCLLDLSYEGVTNALFRQQHLHKQYDIHGMIVQQIRLKDIEKRADKRPTREGIKGTGAFTEAADLILGTHRPAQFKSIPDDKLEVICLKQRMGKPFWAVAFDWEASTGRITGGEEIPYDPSFETSAEAIGDLGEIRIKPGGRKNKTRDG